jgi:hypothetical protein
MTHFAQYFGEFFVVEYYVVCPLVCCLTFNITSYRRNWLPGVSLWSYIYSYMHNVEFHFTMYNQDVIVYAAVPLMFTWCTRRLVATYLFPRRVVRRCPAVELLQIETLLCRIATNLLTLTVQFWVAYPSYETYQYLLICDQKLLNYSTCLFRHISKASRTICYDLKRTAHS